jgi:uncharacterized membrane protein (UPF0127 family)
MKYFHSDPSGRKKPYIILWLLCSLLATGVLGGCVAVEARPPAPSASAPALKLARIGTHTLQIELAISETEQQRGLMHRRELPENQGMLFIFQQEQRLGFWMKNTLLPLSIAFLDKDLRIVDIQDMQPLDETTHISAKPALYALEMNQGWFRKRGIVTGNQLEIEWPPVKR